MPPQSFVISSRLVSASPGEVDNGIAEIEGIPTTAIKEMSSRSRDVEAAVAALGVSSAKARQVAAWFTRAAKDRTADPEVLFAVWDERLNAAGYDQGTRDAVIGRVQEPEPFSDEIREWLFAELFRIDGLTNHEAVFDRRLVVQRLADLAGNRLGADAIDVLSDELLERPELVALAARVSPAADAALHRDRGEAVATVGAQLYSTEAMLALQRRVLAAYERGRVANVGAVAPEVVPEVLADERFARLSHEQREFVGALTGSGMRIQGGVGAAGSGKRTALEAGVAVWTAAGYRVLGAAVEGTQAVVLSEETGVEGRTVASVIARYFDHGDVSLVDDRTVFLVDEASLISTRDFAALAKIAKERGALLRVVGRRSSALLESGVPGRLASEFHRIDRIVREVRSGESPGDVSQAASALSVTSTWSARSCSTRRDRLIMSLEQRVLISFDSSWSVFDVSVYQHRRVLLRRARIARTRPTL